MKKLITILLLAFVFTSFSGVVFGAEDTSSTSVNNDDGQIYSSDTPSTPSVVRGETPTDGNNESNAIRNTDTSPESMIDLYAPFASTGKDIWCKKPRAKCEGAKPGDGCFDYDPGPCQGAEGVTVQRIVTDMKSESILQAYVSMVFRYGLGLGVGAAVLIIVFGGVSIIVSFGDQQALSDGKQKIQQGAIGLVILILAAMILYTINPLFFTL